MGEGGCRRSARGEQRQALKKQRGIADTTGTRALTESKEGTRRTSSPAASANWSASAAAVVDVENPPPRSSAVGTGFRLGLMPELGTGRNFWGEPCARRPLAPEPSLAGLLLLPALTTERLRAR